MHGRRVIVHRDVARRDIALHVVNSSDPLQLLCQLREAFWLMADSMYMEADTPWDGMSSCYWTVM